MKISIGCDEAAYELKEAIKKRLEETGHTCVDNGVEAGETALYPDVAVKTCEKVTSGATGGFSCAAPASAWL